MRVVQDVNLGPNSGEIPNGEFIARFAVNQGSNLHASVRVKLEKSHDSHTDYPVFLYLIDDADWESVIHGGKCENAARKAKYTIPPLTVRGDGEWSQWESVEEQDLPSTTVVYFVITDCAGVTHQSNPSLPKIKVDVHMLNHGSEFSHEESGLIYLYSILFLIYFYFLASTLFTVGKDVFNKSEIDAACIGMVFAIYMELLHIATQCIHLYVYIYNGSGFYILDLASTVLQMNAQVIIVGLFTMIAFGWKVTDKDISKNTTLIFVGVFVCLVQSAMTFLTVIDDGAHHKYHDYGGFQGFILVLLRIFTWIIFVYGIVANIKKVKKKAKPLIKALSVAGSLYMMAFPFLWFLCYIIPAYMQNRVITFGNLGVQLFAIIILLNQLMKRGTKFREASEISKNVFPTSQ